MNVYSRKPLEAERTEHYADEPWTVGFPRSGGAADSYSDAEFAEHFYPAELLDRLIAAARAYVKAIHDEEGDGDRDDSRERELTAAVRAYDEGTA